MAQAARAYAYEPERARRAPRRTRPDVRVVPGGTPREQVAQAPFFLVVARIVAVALVIIAALGIANITLNAATLSETVTLSELTDSISKARAQGNVLEVQKGMLDNSVRIKKMAAEMGMGAPSSAALITLEPDVIATDDAGNLSFARSVARASQVAS